MEFGREYNRTLAFATRRFSDQYRKGADRRPKMNHNLEVAFLIRRAGSSPDEIHAAILHDIVEDTDTTAADVERNFGPVVRNLVDEVTDSKSLKALPLEEKKQQQALRMRTASAGARRIKLADIISNLREIVENPPTDWSYEKCASYVEGSFLVASECAGVSSYLLNEFQIAYIDAATKYGLEKRKLPSI